MSMSGKMMRGDLPPNSSDTFFTFDLAQLFGENQSQLIPKPVPWHDVGTHFGGTSEAKLTDARMIRNGLANLGTGAGYNVDDLLMEWFNENCQNHFHSHRAEIPLYGPTRQISVRSRGKPVPVCGQLCCQQLSKQPFSRRASSRDNSRALSNL